MPAYDFVECFVVLDAVNDMLLVVAFSLSDCAVEVACGFRGAASYVVAH
jgi:hypothetical protein